MKTDRLHHMRTVQNKARLIDETTCWDTSRMTQGSEDVNEAQDKETRHTIAIVCFGLIIGIVVTYCVIELTKAMK